MSLTSSHRQLGNVGNQCKFGSWWTLFFPRGESKDKRRDKRVRLEGRKVGKNRGKGWKNSVVVVVNINNVIIFSTLAATATVVGCGHWTSIPSITLYTTVYLDASKEWVDDDSLVGEQEMICNKIFSDGSRLMHGLNPQLLPSQRPRDSHGTEEINDGRWTKWKKQTRAAERKERGRLDREKEETETGMPIA